MRKRKLLYFVTEDWYFVSHRLQLAVAAQQAGYDVVILTRVREHGDVIRRAGLRVIPFEMQRGGLNPLSELQVLTRLIAVYRRERPDILHHVAMKPVLYGSIAARVAGIGAVLNAIAGLGWIFLPATGRHRVLKAVARRLLGRALRTGLTLLQNPDDLEAVVRLGVPRSRTRMIVGSGVDLSKYAAVPEPTGVPVVVLPARLLWDKGVGEFVRAAAILREQSVVAEFVLAGDPDPDNPASVTAEQLSRWVQDGAVQHLGWVTDIPALLAASSIVCLPSYAEGAPKALIEAAAAGRAVVASDVGGCRAVVRDGETGLLVPAQDADALAAAIARLVQDPDLRRSFGSSGRAHAERELAQELVHERTLALYEELAA